MTAYDGARESWKKYVEGPGGTLVGAGALGRRRSGDRHLLWLHGGEDPAVVEALRTLGHDVELLAPYDATVGHAGAIRRDRTGVLQGGSDPRSDGGVASW